MRMVLTESLLGLELSLHALVDVAREERVASRIHRAVTADQLAHLSAGQCLISGRWWRAIDKRLLLLTLRSLLCSEVHRDLHLSVGAAKVLLIFAQQLLVLSATSYKLFVLLLDLSRIRV